MDECFVFTTFPTLLRNSLQVSSLNSVRTPLPSGEQRERRAPLPPRARPPLAEENAPSAAAAAAAAAGSVDHGVFFLAGRGSERREIELLRGRFLYPIRTFGLNPYDDDDVPFLILLLRIKLILEFGLNSEYLSFCCCCTSNTQQAIGCPLFYACHFDFSSLVSKARCKFLI